MASVAQGFQKTSCWVKKIPKCVRKCVCEHHLGGHWARNGKTGFAQKNTPIMNPQFRRLYEIRIRSSALLLLMVMINDENKNYFFKN